MVPRTGLPFLDEPRERGKILAYAHRGGALHPDLPGVENTRKAFRHAVGLGYRYLETDVHATSDGHLLAFHDAALDRVTEHAGAISEHALVDLAKVLVGGSEPIPRFEELLEEFPDARFNVDLKSAGSIDPMIDLIERMGAHDRVCVGSFLERVLRRFRSRLAARTSRPVATSCGIIAATALKYRGARLVRDSGAAYQVPHFYRGRRIVDQRYVDRAHALDRQVHVWTIDDRAEMEHLLDLGVDGIITDRTDVLKDVLEMRGQW